MSNNAKSGSVTISQTNLEAIREEVFNKDLLIELYVEYFGEAKRERIEEKLRRVYDFVIPVDIPSFNIQKYLIQDERYKDSAYRYVAKTAKNMLYSSPRKNLNRLKNYNSLLCVKQLLRTMSRDVEEPFTLENVFKYDARKFLLFKKEQSGKGERYEEFISKLFSIATEGFEGFDSYDSVTQKLISSLARIDGVAINPKLTITDIQNELSDLFDVQAAHSSMETSLDSLNKIFGTNFRNVKEFEKHPVYKKVCSSINEARIKFYRDYTGRSISQEDINREHWSAFEKDAVLKRKDYNYPSGFTNDAFMILKGSSMGYMTYFKTDIGVYPIVRVALDNRTAFSTSIHEAGHALQMVEKDGKYYTGFSKPLNKVYLLTAFNEFYNEFLAKRVNALMCLKNKTTIKAESSSSYDDGVSLLGEFFEAYENELKENVIDNAFELGVNMFGLDMFVELGAHCEILKNTDSGIVRGLIEDLGVRNLHEAKTVLRENPNLYKVGGEEVFEDENNEQRNKISLASTIRVIDEITQPYISEKNQEKTTD